MGPRLYESELQNSMDFCVKLFNDTEPDEHDLVASSGDIGKELLDLTAPIVDRSVLERAIRVVGQDRTKVNDNGRDGLRVGQTSAPTASEEITSKHSVEQETEEMASARNVLEKINARRVLHSEYTLNGLETEVIDGLTVHLERGDLGLRIVEPLA